MKTKIFPPPLTKYEEKKRGPMDRKGVKGNHNREHNMKIVKGASLSLL